MVHTTPIIFRRVCTSAGGAQLVVARACALVCLSLATPLASTPHRTLQPIKAVSSILYYLGKCTAGFSLNCVHNSLNSVTYEGCTKISLDLSADCILVSTKATNISRKRNSRPNVALSVFTSSHEYNHPTVISTHLVG